MLLGNLFAELRATSKPSEKQGVLKKYDCEFLKDLIFYSYEPFKMYHVRILKKDIPLPGESDIYDMKVEIQILLDFCEKSLSPKRNKDKVLHMLALLNKGSQEFLLGVLNKNWKVGLGRSNILKVFPKIISRFEVQLSNIYSDDKTYTTSIWHWSYKLDGLRCISLRESSDDTYDIGKWTLYTRKGKEFVRVEHLKPQLERMYQKTGKTFFDGELYKHGLAFEDVQGLVMGFKEGQSPEIEYHVFVAGQAENFLSAESIDNVEIVKHSDESHIKVTYKGELNTVDVYDKLDEAFGLGYEGIMLRDPNKLYDYKRSNALIKLKQSKDNADTDEGEIISDCIVKSIEYDDFPVIEEGKMHYEYLLVRLIVMQENNITCKVGSGYTVDFRRQYTENPDDILDKTVEVLHQQWGSNGKMRFPRLHKVRLDL